MAQPGDQTARLAWSTPLPALIAVAVGGVVLAVAAVLNPEPPGKVLLGIAAVALLGLAVAGVRQRPRLSVIPGEDPVLVLRSLGGATPYGRRQIVRARVMGYRRLGRRTPTLEIDVDHRGTERLFIFGRWDLGADPRDVYEELRIALRLPREPGV